MIKCKTKCIKEISSKSKNQCHSKVIPNNVFCKKNRFSIVRRSKIKIVLNAKIKIRVRDKIRKCV